MVNQLPAGDWRVAGYGLQGAQANLWVVCTQRNEQRLRNFWPRPGLQHAGRGGAVVLATHQDLALAYADQVVMLENKWSTAQTMQQQ